MPVKNDITLISLLVLLAACGDRDSSDAAAATADTLFMNARVYTVNVEQPWAEALAVADGKIIAVGSRSDLAVHRGDATEVVDLQGRMVMPGIQDTHIHPSDAGIQKLYQCSFLSYDIDEVLEILKGCISELPDGEWLRGGQWNEGLFQSGRMPKTILDEIAPDHPVFLMDWSVHNAWVNSKALEAFGIDDDTPDPPGGVIVRHALTGEATGILIDNAAYDSRRTLPGYSLDQRVAALSWSLDQIAQNGVTTIKDAIVTRGTAEAYAELDKRGELPLSVKTNLTWKSSWANSHEDEIALIDERAAFASDTVDTDFAKIMLDGIPPTYTAAMLDPYEPSEAFGDDWRGKLMFSPRDLQADVTELDRKGLAVKIHATGDRSAREALNAFEAARKANGDSGRIHEVSHAELIHPDDVPRFAELNVAAEMCPILWHPIPGLDWELWLGPDRKVWPVKRLVESGALVTYGSDWPVVPSSNPWPGIEAMVTRADPIANGADTLWLEQAVDLDTALRIFTLNSAVANGVGDSSGSLEVGKDADFIVLDRNVLEVPITEVSDTVVTRSVIGGKTLFER